MTRGFALVLAIGMFATGCALQPPPPAEPPPLGPGEIRSARAADHALAIGKSTKADVRAMLGDAVIVDFASGYEVWVYRERPAEKSEKPEKPEKPSISELVLLFAPSGILAKTRIRQ